VALQAVIAASESGLVGFFGVEAIENDALLGIESGELQHIAILDVPDGNFVVEVDGAGGAGRDVGDLGAGAGEDEDLGIEGDVELLQDGLKITPVVRREIELGLAGFEALFEVRDGVGSGAVVLDGGVVQRDIEG